MANNPFFSYSHRLVKEVLVVTGLLSMSMVAHAQGVEVNYIGDGVGLQAISLGGNIVGGFPSGSNHLFPGSLTTVVGTMSNNTVTVNYQPSQSSINLGDVYGALSFAGDVTANRVIIQNAQIAGDVYGAFADKGNARLNKIEIFNGSVWGNITGAHAQPLTADPTNKAQADFNTVIIHDGAFDYDILGAFVNVKGDASSNLVDIRGGTIQGNVVGAATDIGVVANNQVNISGGVFKENIVGGIVYVSDTTELVKSINNTVTLSGQPVFDPSITNIVGGWSGTSTTLQAVPPNSDFFTGNTLQVFNPIMSKVARISNFEHYFFMLPVQPTSMSMLNATGTVDLTDGAGRVATIALSIEPGQTVRAGTRYSLIKSDTQIIGDYQPTTLKVAQGTFLTYDVSVEKQNQEITAIIVGAPTNSGGGDAPGDESIPLLPNVSSDLKALSESRLAGLLFINQGADLVANKGVELLHLMASQASTGVVSFGTIMGSSLRYETGSHVDVDGVGLLVGLGRHLEIGDKKLSLGAFFEAGQADYDTYNPYLNRNAIRGSGDNKYYGAGVLARYQWVEGSLSGLYSEASIRLGRVTTDFVSTDIRHVLTGQVASYDESNNYYGAHIGLGYVWPVFAAGDLDASAKYLWTRHTADDVIVLGETVKYQHIDSQRVRLALRYTHTQRTDLQPFVGVAYEYEFDGKASATIQGYAVPEPENKGASGSLELGLRVLPETNPRFFADFSVQAYTGKREGVGGQAKLKWVF